MPYSANACRWTSGGTCRRRFVDCWHMTTLSVVMMAPGVHVGSGSCPRILQPLSFVRGAGKGGAVAADVDGVGLVGLAAAMGVGSAGLASELAGEGGGDAPVQGSGTRASSAAITESLSTVATIHASACVDE